MPLDQFYMYLDAFAHRARFVLYAYHRWALSSSNNCTLLSTN